MKEVSKNGEIATVARKNDVAGKAQMPNVLCGVFNGTDIMS
jgi:hypothetical protein